MNQRHTFSVSVRNFVDVQLDHRNRKVVGPIDGGIVDIIVDDVAANSHKCLTLQDEKTSEQVYKEITAYLKEHDIDGLVPWITPVDPKDAVPGELYHVEGVDVEQWEVEGDYRFIGYELHGWEYRVTVQELAGANGTHTILPRDLAVFGKENIYFSTCDCHGMEILCDLCNGSGKMVLNAMPTLSEMEEGRAYYRKSIWTDAYDFGLLEVLKRETGLSFRFIEYRDGCPSFTADSQTIEATYELLNNLRKGVGTDGTQILAMMLTSKDLNAWDLDGLTALAVELYAANVAASRYQAKCEDLEYLESQNGFTSAAMWGVYDMEAKEWVIEAELTEADAREQARIWNSK